MSNPGSPAKQTPNIKIIRIRKELHRVFDGLIDMSDVKHPDPGEVERKFLSRALAAWAIMSLAPMDAKVAAESVTDAYDECGLDAVYFDRAQRILYLVQSKWSDNGKKTLGPGDFLKLASGFERILNYDLDDFNAKVKKKQTEIYEAVHGTSTIVLVAACTSERMTGIKQEVARFLKKHNTSGTALVHVEQLTLESLCQFLHGNAARSDIPINLTLREWGRVADPYIAYYGQVELSEIIQWRKHGKALFDRNLRYFVGTNSEVFDSITRSLNHEAHHFWYFNNGITILCSTLNKLTIHGESREKGLFSCTGVSVVNGAQTIGSIWEQDESLLDPTARVSVRLIELKNCPPHFAAKVTRATNTQEKIERRHFLALDRNQHRLARELALDGRRYVFMQGDEEPRRDDITASEATVALACAVGDVVLVTEAKREISLLWANIEEDPYKTLFNDDTSAEILWRAVRILRAVEETMSQERFPFQRGRLVAVHGNRFVLYRVFHQDPVRRFRDKALDIEDLVGVSGRLAAAEVARIASDLSEHYPSLAPQNV